VSSFELAQFPVPNGREEEWRFAPVDRLAPLFADELTGPKVITTVVEAPEVTVEVVDRDDVRLGQAGKPGDRTAATAWASFQRATILTVPPQAVASTATMVRVEGIDAAKTTASHILVHARELSEALVVIDHVGPASLAETVEVVVEDGAHLTLVSVQDWAEGSVHASSHRIKVGRDATVKHIVVTLGGDVVRVTPDAEFAGENGSIEMIGLYFADAGQHQEHRLFVDHNVPSCRSRVTYKGALQGEGAHTVWVGVPESDARRLVVRGFFAELIHAIGVPEVEERLLESIEAELEKSMSVLGAEATLPTGDTDLTPVEVRAQEQV
jgi:Fe-S cluster assembly protein SufD